MSQDADTPMTDVVENADTASNVERSKNAVSPGEMLRQARETLNLTISDLAGQTRLSKTVLDSLEKNDFSKLAMPVYVRGYYRKCAHVMNMPEDKLLQAYADWTGTSLAPQPVPVTVSEPPQEYESPGHTPSWRYVLIIAIVLGALLWWFGSGGEMDEQVPVGTDAQVKTLEIKPPVMEPDPPLSLVPDGEAVSAQETGTNAVLPDVSASTEQTTISRQAESTDSAPAAAVPLGPATLELKISQVSWVSVTDDDGKQLIYDLLRSGAELRVTGKPPYKVVLGHPQGVELSIGGKRIDLVPYTSNNGTARLEVEVP